MRIFYGVLVVFVVFILSGFAFIYSGVYNVSAMEEHSAPGKWAFHTTMEHSVAARASDIDVPANLSSEDMISQGARAYDQLCSGCHLKPGQDNTLLRQGLNPTPPSLAETGHFGPAEQFWVIKNGIKMSGMPAWGPTHKDEDLWELTAFIQRLPSLSKAQYDDLVAASSADGHAHDHGNMDGMTGAEEPSHGKPGHHSETGRSKAGQAEVPDHHDEGELMAEGKADDHHADGHSH